MPDRQFYGAIIWYHLMAPFYGMCVPGIRKSKKWYNNIVTYDLICHHPS